MKITVTPKNVRDLLEALGQITLSPLILADELTDAQIQVVAGLFKKWGVGQSVEINDIRQYGGDLYKCIQAHTTQSDWTPDIVPALWTPVSAPGVIPEWVQPPAENPFMMGDIVTYNGKTWQSVIDNNVWAPGVYGWVEI